MKKQRLLNIGMQSPRRSRNISVRGKVAAVLSLAPVSLLFPLSALAQDGPSLNPSLSSPLQIRAGVVINETDVKVGKFIKPTGIGGTVDLSSIGVDERSYVPTVEIMFRSDPRWRFGLAYEHLDLSGRVVADSEINFGDISIPVGFDVRTQAELEFYSGTLGYAFWKGTQSEFGGLVSVYAIDANAFIEGALTLGDPNPFQESASDLLPAGAVGIYGIYALTDQLTLDGRVEYIAGGYDKYSGHFFRADANLTYWFTSDLSLGVGYRFNDFDLRVNNDVIKDTYDVSLHGVRLFAGIAF